MPGYTFHYEVLEKPDGNFLVNVNKTGSTHPNGSPTVEDVIIELSLTTGNGFGFHRADVTHFGE